MLFLVPVRITQFFFDYPHPDVSVLTNEKRPLLTPASIHVIYYATFSFSFPTSGFVGFHYIIFVFVLIVRFSLY